MEREIGRSYEAIGQADLARLAAVGAADRLRFYRTRPEYRGRLLCAALCQGAGSHFVQVARGEPERSGVKDFDVWSFFAAIPGERFPAARRMTRADFGPSRFGRGYGEAERFRHYEGRRVDLLLRALPVAVDADPPAALRDWLHAGRTRSARLLAQKGVVLIEPPALQGSIVWTPRSSS